jgi:hypothetical protein
MILTSSRAGSNDGSVRVGAELMNRLGFTNHAIKRFAARAGLDSTNRDVVEPIVRGLLVREGRVVAARPRWAQSRNTADIYLQLGEWMLFIGCHDTQRAGAYAIVTVVNGPSDNNWRAAHRRGYVSTPPIPVTRGRTNPIASVAIALRGRRPGESLVAAIRRTHRTRRRSTQADYDRALLEGWHRRAR